MLDTANSILGNKAMGTEEEPTTWKGSVESRLHQFHKTLYGNGEPGMDEEIRNIKAMLGVLIKLAWIVTGAVVAVAVTGVVGAMVFIIKNSP